MKSRRGVEPILATVLVVLLTIVSGGIVAVYTIPLVSQIDTSCTKALNDINFQSEGFNLSLIHI